MSSNINVVIGVCVERTTADCPGGNSTEQGLTVHRAKDLARKVRRKGQN
ncbi:hypothetical protein ID866_7211 [Astraeus odoratus]|nr:hypothetical protein ID866_7211 [Astraeus odoratus]